jgi:catechol 2,3-dioxygenase-like lactoylglutathione lyase family enzyme
MTLRTLLVCLSVVMWSVSGGAQAKVTLPFDHVHVMVADPEQGVAWYVKYLGAESAAEDGPARVWYGRARYMFQKGTATAPGDSVVDHFAFSFSDIDAKARELQQAGVTVTTPVHEMPGLYKSAFVKDPWGNKIELVEDPQKLGLHHAHLRVPNPDAVLAWYVNAFGGERIKLKGRVDAVRYSELYLLAEQGNSVGNEGHSFDHIAWRSTDLQATYLELAAKGVTFVSKPTARTNPAGAPYKNAGVTGSAGEKIEMMER